MVTLQIDEFNLSIIDTSQLNQEIDCDSGGVPKQLGKIADSMAEWEGRISDELKLTEVDVAAIKTEYPTQLRQQT